MIRNLRLEERLRGGNEEGKFKGSRSGEEKSAFLSVEEGVPAYFPIERCKLITHALCGLLR